MKKPQKTKTGKSGKLKKRYVLLAIVAVASVVAFFMVVPFGYDLMPGAVEDIKAFPYDPESPWPKFRANALQNGRIALRPTVDPSLRPWTFQTGKGIFSSPVIDGNGTVYIGSADQKFYAIKKDGSVKWSVQTGEIIDSSGLLDDKGRVYFGSGDGYVYAANRESGEVLWKFKAHTVEEVKAEFGIKTYNVNWFEGNVGMLPDGTLLAPNDNYLVYAIDRETGKRATQYVANEMVWSLPAVNARTGKLFFGSTNLALQTFFSYDIASGKRAWLTGGLGSVAATGMLTSDKENGAVVAGGFDGWVRAWKQSSGQQIWATGLRDHVYSSPAQLSDGTIVQPSADGTVYALDPRNGKVKWAFDTFEPIRSSPAVDGNDCVYVGSGEGRLFCINPDGTLRWSYLCIAEDRNDLNASPALGGTGVAIAGESGGVFFVPYDYPLTEAGRADPRCSVGPGENLSANGVFLVYTSQFGKLLPEAPETIEANQALAFTLFVRKDGDTILSEIDRDRLKVECKGVTDFKVDVAANRRFVTITPKETWAGPEGGTLEVSLKGDYVTDMRRFGLKFFLGRKGGNLAGDFRFTIPSRASSAMPYSVPSVAGGIQTVFEASRLAVPNPTMLPSWNQIGFDSLHYLMGTVAGTGNTALVWVVGGKLENGKTVVDPTLQARYPLVLRYDNGLLTLSNYDGFKINFVGSWDMPFGSYRVTAKADPSTGNITGPATLSAIALCDQIAFYGPGLKLMGLSEFDTGKMTVFGGLNLGVWKKANGGSGDGFAKASFRVGGRNASLDLEGSKLRADAHVYSLLLVDTSGRPLPLYYTHNTATRTGADGMLAGVDLSFDKSEKVMGKITAYFMVDTYPAAKGELVFPQR